MSIRSPYSLCDSLSTSEIMDQTSQNLVQMMCLQATPQNVFTLHSAPKSSIKMVDAQTYDMKVMLILPKNTFI